MKRDERVWWKHGVIYQIYPRSFFDSNGDGVGDLEGIIEKLDYVRDLGVDGIWLSPIFVSPMFDFGYDVSDYRGIDPVFGSLEDFDRLLREAHRRQIRVIMDLVMNHTSHLHPWFIESRSSRDNPRRDWYIWHDGHDGKPPNNWLATFGGRAWEWDEHTRQFYLHSFLAEQPDVNWRNPELRAAMFGEIRYWLDRGVDGFRLDVVNWFIKDAELRNNPLAIGPNPRPYDLHKHLYDRNRPETHEVLRELRSLLDSYDKRMSVGEVYSEQPGNPELSASYVGSGEDELHLAFDFSLVYAKWSAREFSQRLERWIGAIPEAGWACHFLANHDQPRSVHRFARRPGDDDGYKRARVAAFLLMTIPGTPFLYYGEELGMTNGRIARSEIVDPVGKRYWPFNKGRDGERTPMQWSDAPHAGFSTGKPWLPVNDDYVIRNAERESRDPSSLLSTYRALIALRKRSAALHRGGWAPLAKGEHDVVSFSRTDPGETLCVMLNFADGERSAHAAEPGAWTVLLSTHRAVGEASGDLEQRLHPYEATIWSKATESGSSSPRRSDR